MPKPTDQQSTYNCPECGASFTVSVAVTSLDDVDYCPFCGEYFPDWENDDDDEELP